MERYSSWGLYFNLNFSYIFQKICEKPQIVNDYEAGRGIPNNVILGKIERVIGLKLRGKERGTVLEPPGQKKWMHRRLMIAIYFKNLHFVLFSPQEKNKIISVDC